MTPATTDAVGGEVRTYLVRGDDPTLVAQEARLLIDRLVGSRESSFVVEEHGASGEDLDVKAVVDACLTPSFLDDRRVVVVRDVGRVGAAEAAGLAAVVTDPLASTVLVLVGGGGTVPQALVKAVGAHGELIDASAGTGRERTTWVAGHLRDAPLRFDAGARSRIQDSTISADWPGSSSPWWPPTARGPRCRRPSWSRSWGAPGRCRPGS
jgi:DNA polymerase III delta subunit